MDKSADLKIKQHEVDTLQGQCERWKLQLAARDTALAELEGNLSVAGADLDKLAQADGQLKALYAEKANMVE